MLTFHGEPALKAALLERAKAHRLADDYCHGIYWAQIGGRHRGCTVGCLSHSVGEKRDPDIRVTDMLETIESQFGLPVWLLDEAEAAFEALGSPEDRLWTEEFVAAVPVGVHLPMPSDVAVAYDKLGSRRGFLGKDKLLAYLAAQQPKEEEDGQDAHHEPDRGRQAAFVGS